jgi:hypothetical protein
LLPGKAGGHPGSAKRMINIFGIKIEAPRMNTSHLFDELLVSVAKKESERNILRQFLTARIPEIITHVKEESTGIKVDDLKSQTLDFYLSQLKTTGIYEKMVLKVISSDYQFSSARIAKEILNGRQPTLPSTFPGDHKKAETLVIGAVSSSIGPKECQEYLARKFVKSYVQEIARDLFYAVNNNLNSEQSLKYMAILYELNKLKTADFTNNIQIKKNLIKSITTGEPVNLIHIKCLRFTYPKGNSLRLLDHTLADDHQNNFSRRPQDETPIFVKLKLIKSIFENNGINSNFSILVSDQDLTDYFPKGGEGIIPDDDLKKTKTDIIKYQLAVSRLAPFASVKYLRQYLDEQDLLSAFDSSRQKIISELSRGVSALRENFIEEKVNYRFESNSRIFTSKPNRNFARSRVYAQVASLQSLSVLGQENILIEEDHGNDNQFIGGYRHTALPVIFVNLKC